MDMKGEAFSEEVPILTLKHLDALRSGSGLSLNVIQERGYRSMTDKKQLADAGFAASQQVHQGC
jgi:hypothetical protein